MNPFQQRVLKLIILGLAWGSPFWSWALVPEDRFTPSAQWGGLAGAGLAKVASAESALLNPAGLARVSQIQFQMNVDKQWMDQSSGFFGATSSPLPQWNNLGSVFFAYPFQNGWVAGFGVSPVVNREWDYEGFTIPRLFHSGSDKGFESTWETTFAFAKKITPELSFGLGWRINKSAVRRSAPLSATPQVWNQVDVKNLSGIDYGGMRAGIQYQESQGDWGVGAAFRNRVRRNLEGGMNENITNLATGTEIPGGVGSAWDLGNLPWQISLGTFLKANNFLKVFLQYDYSHTSEVNSVLTYIGAGTYLTYDFNLNWENTHTLRLGVESDYFGMPLRAGVAYFTQTVFADHTMTESAPPAPGYILALGTGFKFFKELQFDFSASYQAISGRSTGTTYAFNDGMSSLKIASIKFGFRLYY